MLKASILFILLLIGLSSSCHAQAPILSTEEPLKLSEHFNSKSFILDYLIEKDATCSLILQKIDKTRVYYLKDKFIKEGQYELSISETQLKADSSIIRLECDYGVSELLHSIEDSENESP